MTDETSNPPAEGPAPDAWSEFIGPFAEAIGKDVPDITTALKPLVGEPGEQAIQLLGNEEFTPFEEIKGVLSDVPSGLLKMAVREHLRASANTEPEVIAPSLATPSFDALPPVPGDDAWLTMLRTGGELKVDTARVIAAVRAALASRSNLFELPTELIERMETHATELEEPVG